MMYEDVLLAVLLLPFTGLDGQKIELNPIEIISIREPRSSDHFGGPAIKCVIFTTDGKFIPVQETCKQVHDKIDGGR